MYTFINYYTAIVIDTFLKNLSKFRMLHAMAKEKMSYLDSWTHVHVYCKKAKNDKNLHEISCKVIGKLAIYIYMYMYM